MRVLMSPLQKNVKEEVATGLISSSINGLFTGISNLNSVYIEFMTLGDEINNLILLFICSVFHFIITDSSILSLSCSIKWGVESKVR